MDIDGFGRAHSPPVPVLFSYTSSCIIRLGLHVLSPTNLDEGQEPWSQVLKSWDLYKQLIHMTLVWYKNIILGIVLPVNVIKRAKLLVVISGLNTVKFSYAK